MIQYLNLLQEIKDKGTYKPPARENMPGTLSLFGYQFRHNLAEGFPLLTTKKLSFKNIVVELLWFLRGDTNIQYLLENGCNIWNEDAYNYYIKKCNENNVIEEDRFKFDDFITKIKGCAAFPSPHKIQGYILGDCGFQYGKVWRSWNGKPYCVNFDHDIDCTKIDQIVNLIEGLINNPEGRRHIVTSIDPSNDKDLALYWCHCMFQMNCRPSTREQRQEYFGEVVEYMTDEQLDERNVPKYYLDCQMYQRSCDVFLGVPYNIASYALLTHIIAKMCNMIPGEYIHTFGDVHIYDNHKEAVEEQLKRNPTELPILQIWERNKEGYLPDNFDKFLSGRYTISDFLSRITIYDFRLEGYNPQEAIKAELSTGLKK